MPRVSKHLRLAGRNGQTLRYLLQRVDEHPEWVATVSFYRALQIVEAVIVEVTGSGSSDHGERHGRIKRSQKMQHIWRHYRPLMSASKIARYLQDERGSDFECFADYMGPAEVRSELVHHNLAQVEKSARRLLKPMHAAILDE